MRQTITYAVEELLEGDGGLLRVVLVYPSRTDLEYRDPSPHPHLDNSETILGQVESWVRDDAGERAETITVETAHLGTDEYLFSPQDVTRVLRADAAGHRIDRVILDPAYDPHVGVPLVRPLVAELEEAGVSAEQAPIDRPRQPPSLLGGVSAAQAGVLFGVSFLFYQLLAGGIELFDLVTGAVGATIVTVAVGRITFDVDPGGQTIAQVLRAGWYVPYLLGEIIKSNVRVAALLLDPRRSADPKLVRVRPAVWGSGPLTLLANSITLTPGTLTVRVGPLDGQQVLLIHSLAPWAREGLLDGDLERAVRYLFYGDAAGPIPSPRERGDGDVRDSTPETTGEEEQP